MSLIILCVIVACMSAFIYLLLSKWGFVEWLQVNGNELFSRMAQCEFCMSWWLNVIITFGFALTLGFYWQMLLVPVVATPITRKLL